MRHEVFTYRDGAPADRPLAVDQPRFAMPQPDYIDVEFEVIDDGRQLERVCRELAIIERVSVVESVVKVVEKEDEEEPEGWLAWLFSLLPGPEDYKEWARQYEELMMKDV